MKQGLKTGLAAAFAIAFVTAIAVAGKLSGWGPADGDVKVSHPSERHLLKTGAAAPDFEVQSLEGKQITLDSLKGKPIMLDFWATWCGPCVESLPDTEKATIAFPNVTVLAISDESRSTLHEFLNANPLQINVCVDEDSDASDAYHVSAIPCRVFIDRHGKIVDVIEGSGQEEQVRADLNKIDSEK